MFTNMAHWADDTRPIEASKCLPEWYKKTDKRTPNNYHYESIGTIKSCMPVFDALTAGYILHTPCDVYVEFKDGQPFLKASLLNPVISEHSVKQGHLHPEANGYSFQKWLNSWAIKTPKGYSCLFIQPMHNPNEWFTILEGIVDTDEYINPVNFPFVLKDIKKEGIIPKGTPIAQIIPFKRDDWSIKYGDDSDYKAVVIQLSHLNSVFWNRYKRLFRKEKNWNVKNEK
jgi:hypothetical protein